MLRTRIVTVVLPILLAGGLAAPVAVAATGTGTYRVDRPAGVGPAAHASWSVNGTLLGARAEAPLVGVAVLPFLTDSDSRYVLAKLVSAEQPAVTVDCGDGLGGTTTQQISGVASARAAIETQIDLNLLHGKGTAQIDIGASPYQGTNGTYFAPGLAKYIFHSTCFGTVQDSTDAVPVVGDPGPTLFTDHFGNQAMNIRWPLVRTPGGVWHVAAHRTLDVSEKPETITVNMSFAGSATSLHAACVMPTVRDLRGAKTLKAARRIAARGGFPHTIAGKRRTRATKKGRYFIMEAVGNGNAVPCGYRRLHLIRSLGWN
jgi:hypothetical protein